LELEVQWIMLKSEKKRFGTKTKDDKVAARKARFGVEAGAAVNADSKVQARKKRFGNVDTSSMPSLISDEKKRKRMERFGMKDEGARVAKRRKRFANDNMKSTGVDAIMSDDKMKARKERFSTETTETEDSDKIAARKAKFADL